MKDGPDVPRTTLVLGVVLVLLGVVSWAAAGFDSPTALIPSALGLVLVVCGAVARTRPKIGVHAALVVALLGVLGSLRNVLGLPELVRGESELPLAVISGTVMFVLLVGYLVLGVRSFRAARRA